MTKKKAASDDDDDDESEPQRLQKQNAKMRWQGPGNALCLQVRLLLSIESKENEACMRLALQNASRIG